MLFYDSSIEDAEKIEEIMWCKKVRAEEKIN